MLTDIQITTIRQILSNFNPDVSESQSSSDMIRMLKQYQREVLLPGQQQAYVNQLAALSSRNPADFSKVKDLLSPAMRDSVQTAISVINPPIKIK